MSSLLNLVIEDVERAQAAWFRYITGNDTGTTGSHQQGFYIPKCAAPLLFSTPCRKGENREKTVRIRWQNDFNTESRMKYYGVGSRNEFRITRFGRDFPFLTDDNVGDLLILAKHTEEEYTGYVLHHDSDIDDFCAYFSLAPGDTNRLISTSKPAKDELAQLLAEAVQELNAFPDTRTMSYLARECYNKANHITPTHLIHKSDALVLEWINTEYSLFKAIEDKLYAQIVNQPFGTVERFVQTAGEILNRRKARAGKSLEHQLAYLFEAHSLIFEEQAVTENKKTPDFLFPDGERYHNFSFPVEGLTMLGAKTTCKDRWRQVLTEADRLPHKYLFTLQQGVSGSQLQEMHAADLTLVVPEAHIQCFPITRAEGDVISLTSFIQQIKEQQRRFL